MSKKDKIGYCILHYYAIDVTIGCVESIIDTVGSNDYEIVIVDNASPNGTGKELLDKYKDEKKIHVLINEENLGFARGNNVGFRYLKYDLGCNYIVMLNNDVIIKTKDFFKKIKEEYKNSNYAVMGPKIYNKGNKLQENICKIRTIKEVEQSIRNSKIGIILCDLHLLKIYNKLSKKNKSTVSNVNDGIRKEDVVLHGCCFIFSPSFVKEFDGLDDRTYLYGEEELLYMNVKKKKLTTLYNPDIEILHLRNVSTNKSNTNYYKNKKKVFKNLINSDKIILEDLKKEQNNK